MLQDTDNYVAYMQLVVSADNNGIAKHETQRGAAIENEYYHQWRRG